MNFKLLINKLLRLPLSRGSKLFDEYYKNKKSIDFFEQQMALDILTQKANTHKMFKEESFEEALLHLHIMCFSNSIIGRVSFEEMKKFPMAIWIESIGSLKDDEIISVLNNYAKEFPSMILETFIINLSDQYQAKTIERYKDLFDSADDSFDNFYYSVCEEARKRIRVVFPDLFDEDVLLKLQDLPANEAYDYIKDNLELFKEENMDDIMEILLVNISSNEIIVKILDLLGNKVEELSNERFELFICRYKYLRDRNPYYYNFDMPEFEVDNEDSYSDKDLLKIFNKQIHNLGLKRTLELFDAKVGYWSNEFCETIIYDFLADAYEDNELAPFINDNVITNLTRKYTDLCHSKEFTIEEFYRLVEDLEVRDKTKLIHDDYIEAIVACGHLMQKRLINDKDAYFISLRDKFIKQTMLKVEKDGSLDEHINLNGIFYRLVKGNLDFDTFYKVKTYRGLIYLAKSGMLSKNADIITKFLSDNQVAKLNITPLLRWNKEIRKEDISAESISFFERMGLQLLCYFGEERGKHLLTSKLPGNVMENLFDGIDYKTIEIDENGKPIINMDLMNFLFGKGSIREEHSIINKMIRREIVDFEKYFVELCNNFYTLMQELNNVLSVKRIIGHYENVILPIELMPDEIGYIKALRELNTTNDQTLKDAVSLCNDSKKREYSTIPNIKGTLGKFKYEILDYRNPLAVAVGYLSHCCFTVHGISYTALKHSMQSVNGRTFVVYYQGQFLCQSWIWRNGDVICFDSVEAGSATHGAYNDEIKLVDVYKSVAGQMISLSSSEEDEIQRVKVVTVGKSDFRFPDLETVEGVVARPLERDVYVYDSSTQKILAGSVPKNPRYGEVGVQYTEPREKVICISDTKHVDVDLLDDAIVKIFGIRYQVSGNIDRPDMKEFKKVFVGQDWYVTIDQFDTVDYGVMNNRGAKSEFNEYVRRYGIQIPTQEINSGYGLKKSRDFGGSV